MQIFGITPSAEIIIGFISDQQAFNIDEKKSDNEPKNSCECSIKSAYDIWIETGNKGSKNDFLLSLRGYNGIQGRKGEKGDKGDKGEQGLQGVQGIQGIQGVQGIQGTKGDTGVGITFMGSVATENDLPTPSTQGHAYIVQEDDSFFVGDAIGGYVSGGSIQGPQGEQGIQGEQGPQGVQGIQGIQGPGLAESFMTLTSDYTTSNDDSLKKLFNVGASGNGAFSAEENTTYFFECQFRLSGMSGTSGSFSFGLLGTATITIDAFAEAIKSTSTNAFFTTLTTTSATQISSANTSAVGQGFIKGKITVTNSGTIIPAFKTSVAAATVVKAGSYFRIYKAGSNTVTYLGSFD